MENVKFKPKVDKLFFTISIPTMLFMLAMTALPIIYFEIIGFIIIALCDILVVYFLISPLFGYVELRDETVFIKYGFFLKREIPYSKIRALEAVERRWYSDSMMSLKNSFDHVNIKYNKFEVTSISVIENDELIKKIDERIKTKK